MTDEWKLSRVEIMLAPNRMKDLYTSPKKKNLDGDAAEKGDRKDKKSAVVKNKRGGIIAPRDFFKEHHRRVSRSWRGGGLESRDGTN